MGTRVGEVWVLPHAPGLHHFFLPVSRPGPSRAASPPGPGKETAPAHLPVPREQCSPCCQQPFGHASSLISGSCSAAQRPTPIPSFPCSTYVARRRASGGVSAELSVLSLFHSVSLIVKASILSTLLNLAPALRLPVTSASLGSRAVSTPLFISN